MVVLEQFVSGLNRWNRVYNLTAVHEPEAMVGYHLLDSLSVLPWLSDTAVLDVGSGAGLPGIPLAICRPDQQFTLLDSSEKRIRFVRQMIAELPLSNVSVERTRIEDFHPRPRYQSIVSRAFAPLPRMLSAVADRLQDGGQLLAYKGSYPSEELSDLDPRFEVLEIVPLIIPGIPTDRHLVHLRKVR